MDPVQLRHHTIKVKAGKIEKIPVVGNMMQSVVLDGNLLDNFDGNLLDEVVLDGN